MKNIFSGFYPNSTEKIDLTLKGTLVTFDANVLLNLYRYPLSASEDIFRLMEGLGDKIWLPYHAGLEYQRNRLVVIADQKRRFREVKTTIEKGIESIEGDLGKLQLQKRHSTINISKLLSDLHIARDDFFAALEEKEAAQRDVTDDDPTRERLNILFRDRIGKPPDQDWIKKVEEDGKSRYTAKCPPGYCDQAKAGEVFTHEGAVYKREFGDLFLWKQLLEYAKNQDAKQLILVTDDDKEDWW